MLTLAATKPRASTVVFPAPTATGASEFDPTVNVTVPCGSVPIAELAKLPPDGLPVFCVSMNAVRVICVPGETVMLLLGGMFFEEACTVIVVGAADTVRGRTDDALAL